MYWWEWKQIVRWEWKQIGSDASGSRLGITELVIGKRMTMTYIVNKEIGICSK